MNEAPDARATSEDAEARGYFAGLRDRRALTRLHLLEDLFLAVEASGTSCPSWLTAWMSAQIAQASRPPQRVTGG